MQKKNNWGDLRTLSPLNSSTQTIFNISSPLRVEEIFIHLNSNVATIEARDGDKWYQKFTIIDRWNEGQTASVDETFYVTRYFIAGGVYCVRAFFKGGYVMKSLTITITGTVGTTRYAFDLTTLGGE